MLASLLAFLTAIHIHLPIRVSTSKKIKADEHPAELIVWNIGQGQWVTYSNQDFCLHFDMGGEHADWTKLKAECGNKNNISYFSHWDNDHLSFAAVAAKRFKNFCVAAFPRGPNPSPRKLKIFENLKRCRPASGHGVEEIYSLPNQEIAHFNSNDYSRVFELGRWMLAPGDSTKRQEKIWRDFIHVPEQVRVLILGHHGSHTSTSEELLSSLKGLRIAISSAREARYGHPHREVLARLKRFGVACLRTEYWGNIHMEIDSK